MGKIKEDATFFFDIPSRDVGVFHISQQNNWGHYVRKLKKKKDFSLEFHEIQCCVEVFAVSVSLEVFSNAN